jgi:hypothetical protein
LRYFLSRRIPEFARVVVVESGSRKVSARLISVLSEKWGSEIEIDLVTCYTGVPEEFRGRVYRVADYKGPAARRRLYRELAARQYDLAGILCSGDPIMTKWKWVLAARLRSKIFVVNENADFFWLDRGHWRNVLRMVQSRTGISGGAVVPSLSEWLLFPVTLTYLLLFAGAVHLKRKLRAQRSGS